MTAPQDLNVLLNFTLSNTSELGIKKKNEKAEVKSIKLLKYNGEISLEITYKRPGSINFR